MQTRDIPRFAFLMNQLFMRYNQTTSEISIELYWNALKRFLFRDVEKVIEENLSQANEKPFMPKVGELIAAIEGTPETKAFLAWEKVNAAIRQVGAYDSISFDDALIHSVIDALGGWIRLCMTKIDQLPFVARDFQKRYVLFLKDPPCLQLSQVRGILTDASPIRISATPTTLALKKAENATKKPGGLIGKIPQAQTIHSNETLSD